MGVGISAIMLYHCRGSSESGNTIFLVSMLAPSFQSGYSFCRCGLHNGPGPERISLSSPTCYSGVLQEKMQKNCRIRSIRDFHSPVNRESLRETVYIQNLGREHKAEQYRPFTNKRDADIPCQDNFLRGYYPRPPA